MWIAIIAFAITFLFIKLYEKNATNGAKKDARVTKIAAGVSDIINGYNYAAIRMTVRESYPGQDIADVQYLVSSVKDSHEHSYMSSLDGIEYKQYWNRNENENYDVYLKTSALDDWVYTESDEEPMYFSGWDFAKDLENAFLVSEDGVWLDDTTECYILELLSSSDTYKIIYSQYYIRKSDYMPIGIVAYAVDSIDNDDVKLKDQSIISIGDLDINQETYVPDHHEKVEICELLYSTEDLKMFGAPDKYITYEEYLERNKEVD